MIYVMSDLHGCYEAYKKALDLIQLQPEDDLYILGDVCDRGSNPVAILKDMMQRDNVYPLMGNHDYIALVMLKKLCVKITEENVETHLSTKDMEAFMMWMQDGGQPTVDGFKALSYEEKMDVLDYLSEFSMYEEVSVNGKDYVLVHADLHNFHKDRSLDSYGIDEMVFQRCNYDQMYFEDKYVITGHTPTILIDESQAGQIIEKNNHIAIDCGCVFGFGLGIYCLDTQEKFYVR